MTAVSRTQHFSLVLAADDGFAMPLAVALSSALRLLTDGPVVDIYILDGGIQPARRRRIEAVVRRADPARRTRLSWVTPPAESLPDLSGYRFAHSAINAATFLRFALPAVVPSDCERALFLDADVVVKADLRALANSIPANSPLAAVRDFGMPTFSARQMPADVAEFYDITNGGARYFNAGMLAVNVRLWREQSITENACRVVGRHAQHLRFNDQDALNLILHDRWVEMDLSWNVGTGGPDRIRRMGGCEQELLGEPYEQIRQRAKIIHFTGKKPWDQGFTNPDRPAFVEALRESGWFSPLEFRRWQAGWWGRLAKRQIQKRWGRFRQHDERGALAAR